MYLGGMHVSVLFQRPIILGPYICSTAIRCEVGAQCGDHVLVILVAAVTLNIEVPTIDKGAPEGSRYTPVRCITIGVPKVLPYSLSLLLGLQRICAGCTAKR